MKRFGLLASMTLALACGDDGSSNESESEDETGNDAFGMICTPGVPTPCTCPDGSQAEAPCIGGSELGACECADGTTGSTTDPTTTSTSSGTDTTTTTTTTTTSSSTGSSSGGDTGGVGCGNNVVEDGEQCDDGDDDDTDECSNTCIASCGVEWLEVADTIDAVGRAVGIDSDGDYVVASAGADGLMYVEKYLPDGTLDWSNSYDVDGLGGDAEAVPLTVATFGNDSIFIGGRLGPTGSPRIFVHHLTGAGVEVANWPTTAGTSDGGSLATDSNGNVILVGWLNTGGAGGQNLAVRKFAPDASITWTFTTDTGGGQDDRGRAAAVDGANNIWVGVDVFDGANWSAGILQLPPNDGGGTPVSNLSLTGPLVTGNGIPPNRTMRGIANNTNNNAIVAIATDPSEAANTWDFWVTEIDNTGTTLWRSSATDLAIAGSARTVTGVGLDSSDQLSLVGSVDSGGAALLVNRVSANGNTLLCSRETTDALIGNTFTVGTFGTTSTGTMAVAGGTSAGTPNPWIARFRP